MRATEGSLRGSGRRTAGAVFLCYVMNATLLNFNVFRMVNFLFLTASVLVVNSTSGYTKMSNLSS
jgi:hypothetical protein